MNTWKKECVMLLEKLGGHAYLSDIYSEFLKSHTRKIINSYQAAIRDALEKGCKESDKFDGHELFYMVEGKNKGHYGLIQVSENSCDLTADDDEFVEGKKALKEHIRRERNQLLITKAKRKFKETHNGRLYCEVCGFDFTDKYGELGEGFIESHHTKPISQMKSNEKTKIEDIVMLCSNCHSMIHRYKPWIRKNDLKKLIKNHNHV